MGEWDFTVTGNKIKPDCDLEGPGVSSPFSVPPVPLWDLVVAEPMIWIGSSRWSILLSLAFDLASAHDTSVDCYCSWLIPSCL